MLRILAALAALMTLAAAPTARADDWRQVSETAVGLTLEMPGDFERTVDELDPGDARGDITLALERDQAIYLVQISQAAIDLGDPEAGSQQGVDELKRRMPGVKILSDDIRPGDVFQRTTVALRPTGGLAVQVCIFYGRTLIIALYLQPDGKTVSAEGQRFIDSLHLETPTI